MFIFLVPWFSIFSAIFGFSHFANLKTSFCFKIKIIFFRMIMSGGISPPYGCDSPGQVSCGDRSPVMSQPSPTTCTDPFLSNGLYGSDSEASPNPNQVKKIKTWRIFINYVTPFRTIFTSLCKGLTKK